MKQETRKEVSGWICFLIIVLAVSFFVNKCVIINAKVPTSSMENLIKPGDRLIGNRLAYIREDPERFDVAIFKYPVDENKNFIKRVIGLPGETVRISEGKIYINDETEPLDEPYLKEEWVVLNDGFEFHVPENCYLMLGDNRNDSIDARSWMDEALESGIAATEDEAEQFAYVSKDKILGKAEFKYWSSLEWLNKK